MDWAALIAMIIKVITECMENRDRVTVERQLAHPGFGEAWALRKILRKETGLRGRALYRKIREGMAYLDDMDAEEIGVFLDEAEAQRGGKTG